ncbi:putative dihydrodipicolinate synthase [Thozetella sp. PMI_491]|nr:putative dihydrodipicolinate synthase [Thozetella sp. PMI_491]
MTSASRSLPRGIYTPLPTFFTPDEELDLVAFAAHVVFTARAGTIPVVSGSAGEAPHLIPSERITLIQTARTALDGAGLTTVPIVAGVGVASTRESISLAKDAASAGADYVMVIPPGYYAGTLQADGKKALRQFLVEVAEGSPLPVVVYNFPAVSSGIDLDSDLIIDVAQASSNIFGVKLTCASVGKITRINAVVNSPEFKASYPRKNPEQEFQIIDGFIDILVPSMASGAAGAISGLPNIVPRLCVKMWNLADLGTGPNSPEYKEAQRIQNVTALADGLAQGIGIPGLKMLVSQRFGYGANPRRPLLAMKNEEGVALMKNKYIAQLLEEEAVLETQV